MKLGLIAGMFGDVTIQEAAKLAAENGYEAIEVCANEHSGMLNTDEVLKSGKGKAIAKSVRDCGVEISALSNHDFSLIIGGPHGPATDFIMKGTPEEKIAAGKASLIKTAQLANEMEVDTIVGMAGVLDFCAAFSWPYADGWKLSEEAFVENYVPVLDKLQEYGCRFAVEVHPNSIMYDLYTCKRAIELTGNHPALGINLDPGNLMYVGVGIEEFIDALSDRIYYVHLKDGEYSPHNFRKGGWLMRGEDTRIDKSFRYRIPGWGNINWRSFMTELHLIGYDGYLSFEHEDAIFTVMDGVKKTRDFIRPLMIES
ncbi:MAG: sugar phosphate isomerase/epimerase family protein [Bilifractor sp.]|jgi:sugar phosphate isomerase/epimerase